MLAAYASRVVLERERIAADVDAAIETVAAEGDAQATLLEAGLKAAVPQLCQWALHGVHPEATHAFTSDALRLAP